MPNNVNRNSGRGVPYPPGSYLPYTNENNSYRTPYPTRNYCPPGFENNSYRFPYSSGFQAPQFQPPNAWELSERYLPKPSIEKFDGDLLDYWGFVNRFQIHIDSKVATDDLRLVYLLQHCSEKVYEKVKHFAGNIDAHTGYNLVWQELFRRYGQPHVISRCCEERLLKVSKFSQHDVDGLENLVILLKRCQASLMTNNEPSAVDSVNVLAALVQKLPTYVQHNWIKTALEIEQRCDRLARFNDFVEFVSKESIMSNSTYHAALFPSN